MLDGEHVDEDKDLSVEQIARKHFQKKLDQEEQRYVIIVTLFVLFPTKTTLWLLSYPCITVLYPQPLLRSNSKRGLSIVEDTAVSRVDLLETIVLLEKRLSSLRATERLERIDLSVLKEQVEHDLDKAKSLLAGDRVK